MLGFLTVWTCLLPSLLTLQVVEAQRLTSQVSDWYLPTARGRNNILIEKPVSKSLKIRSEVEHRYAITNVQAIIHNPANTISQGYTFKFIVPRTAFISRVSLTRSQKSDDESEYLTSRLNQSEWLMLQLQQNEDDDVIFPKNNFSSTLDTNKLNKHSFNSDDTEEDYIIHHQFKSKQDSLKINVKQFSLPINIRPLEEVNLTLVYEYALERSNNKYSHVISVYPGEIIQDFQIQLKVTEKCPLVGLKAFVPGIGHVTPLSFGNKAAKINIQMNLVEQFDYFGNQGFAGNVQFDYDVELDGESQMVTKNGFFAHFYHGPPALSDLHVIPMHVLILVDIGRSMGGPKLIRAKELVQILVSLLDENFLLNMFAFNETVAQWRPEELTSVEEAFHCTSDIIESSLAFVEDLEAKSADVSNLTAAVMHAIELDRRVGLSGQMPSNALTTIVLITDGRSGRCNQQIQKKIVQSIHKANRNQQIPIFTLGVGFDTNMELLEEISDRTPGGVAENIKEDLDAGSQLNALRLHLKDIILKNVNFNYVGKEFNKNTLTRSRFKYFPLGGSVMVAGKYDQAFPPRVTITGESVKGHYEEILDQRIFGAKKTCLGSVTLCSEARFRGECIILSDSRPSLKDKHFSNRAVSIKIVGECAWIVCELKNYRGFNLTLLPGTYEILPDMHKRISSLKKIPLYHANIGSSLVAADADSGNEYTNNIVARIWAYHTLQTILDQEDEKVWGNDASERRQHLLHAYQLASDFGFLTPVTDMYLKSQISDDKYQEPSEDETNIFLTYGDLNPVISQVDDPDIKRQWAIQKVCTHPIQCEGNFLFEHYSEEASASLESDNLDLTYGKQNCTGSITVYTKSKMRGDSLKVEESLCQLYHAEFIQRIMSVRSEGNCCWILFQQRFFQGDSERVCGKYSREVKLKNVRSVMRIGSG